MPQGKGTYGSKVGRPPEKKKDVTKVKKAASKGKISSKEASSRTTDARKKAMNSPDTAVAYAIKQGKKDATKVKKAASKRGKITSKEAGASRIANRKKVASNPLARMKKKK